MDSVPDHDDDTFLKNTQDIKLGFILSVGLWFDLSAKIVSDIAWFSVVATKLQFFDQTAYKSNKILTIWVEFLFTTCDNVRW